MGATAAPPPPPPPPPPPLALLGDALRGLRLALLATVLVILHSLVPQSPAPSTALAALRAAAPRCAPLAPENNNGSWSYAAADGRLLFPRTRACAFSVASAGAFFERFDGRTLAFVGDSQVREFSRNVMAHLLQCCFAQPGAAGECDEAAVLDAALCAAIAVAESYPATAQRFVVRDARGRACTFVYQWTAYPPEALELGGAATYFSAFLAGNASAQPDAVLMSWGHWDLIFTAPRRSDNFGGLEALLANAKPVAAAVAAAAAGANPAVLRKLTWRQMYPDEIDALPHPQFRKRMILPQFREMARAGLRELWAGAGLVAQWDVFRKLDVRAGGVQRAINDNMLTIDGMHLLPQVDVELSWELFSFWAEEVVGRAL